MKNLALQPLQNEKRELELAINGLKSQRDIALRETTEASASLADIIQRTKDLSDEVDQLATDAISASRAAKECVNTGVQAVQDTQNVVTFLETSLKSLEQVLDKISSDIEKAKTAHKTQLAEIARENEALGVRKRDLDIYTERLKKKYAELDLGDLRL